MLFIYFLLHKCPDVSVWLTGFLLLRCRDSLFLSFPCTPSSFTVWIRYLCSWPLLKSSKIVTGMTGMSCYSDCSRFFKQLLCIGYPEQPGLISCGTWNKMKLARGRVCWMRNKINALVKKLELSMQQVPVSFQKLPALSLKADTVGGRER